MMEALLMLVLGLPFGVTGIVIAQGFYRLVDRYDWRGWYIDY